MKTMNLNQVIHFPRTFLPVFLLSVLFKMGSTEILSGKIFNRSAASNTSERTVPNAQITLYDSLGKKLSVKKTNKNGAFLFSKLNPGFYAITITAKNYFPISDWHFITILPRDTVAHFFQLDKIINQKGTVTRVESRKKKPKVFPYENITENIVSSINSPPQWNAFYRDDETRYYSLSQIYTFEDTTSLYRKLWMELTWAEIESQDRPYISQVYLAHALDSALQANSLPVPTSLKPYLKISLDSIEAHLSLLRSIILLPTKKNSLQLLAQKNIPKHILKGLIEDEINSNKIPKHKKKKFLKAARKLIGENLATTLSNRLEPSRKTKRASPLKESPFTLFEKSQIGFLKILEKNCGRPIANPTACYALARLDIGNDKLTEAISKLEKVNLHKPDYPKAIFSLANSYLSRQDTLKAMTHFDSLTKVEPPEWQAIAFRSIAPILWNMNQDEKAEAALWRARGLDSKSYDSRLSLYLLAEVSLSRGTWKSVENLLDTALIQNPKEAETHYWLGKMALRRQQDGVALDHFQKATNLIPKQTKYSIAAAELFFSREEYSLALKILEPLRSKLSANGIDIYAQSLVQVGRTKDALLEFEKLFASRPSAQTLAPYGKLLIAIKQSAKAISLIENSSMPRTEALNKILAEAKISENLPDEAILILQPLAIKKETDAEIHFLLGRAEYQKRNYAKASSELTLALQYREDYPQAKFQQGLALLKQGRAGEAHHYFLDLIESTKQSWQAKGFLGQGQAFAKENKLEAAMENLEKSVAAQPTAEAAAHLASILVRLEKLDEAWGWAVKATQLDAHEPLALMARVDILFSQNKEVEAIALAKNGVIQNPGSCEFIIIVAKAYLKGGQDTESQKMSLRAKEICPEESAPYFFLGTVAHKKGTVAEARKHFEDYMRTGGDAKRVPLALR